MGGTYLPTAVYLIVLSLVFFIASIKGQNNQTVTEALSASKPTPLSTAASVPDIQPAKQDVKHLRAVTLLDPPFVLSSRRGEKYEGLVIDILNEAIKNIGYDVVNIDIHTQGIFGYEESPGKWNGLIGAVQNKSADVAVAAFTINSTISSVVTFSQPFMNAGFRVLYKIPDSWHPGEAMVTILRPFTPGLWVLIVFMFVLASSGLYIIGRFSPYEDIAFVGKTATYDGLTLANSLLYVFSSLVWQGYTAAPKSISGRILTCIWWVFSVFTIGAYIAGLCVILFKTNPEIRTLPFTTMSEMSRQNKVGIMVVKNSATYNYLSSSTGEIEKRILAKLIMQNKLLVDNTEHAIDKMMQSDGSLALLMDGPAAEYISTKEPCDKMVIGDPLGFHTYGFACRNDTNICEKLSTQILAMLENGQLSGFRDKWLNTGCVKDRPKSYIYEGLPFFDTFGGEPDAIMPLTITIKRFCSIYYTYHWHYHCWHHFNI
uniref:Ionotropic glutamate receptor C-terminal domain-containing protein n=1 Tax=Arion vulgaris TaxID=1028688 RepID=A0A0B7ALY3_9EUPU